MDLIWRWRKKINFDVNLIWRFRTKIAKIAKFSPRQNFLHAKICPHKVHTFTYIQYIYIYMYILYNIYYIYAYMYVLFKISCALNIPTA